MAEFLGIAQVRATSESSLKHRVSRWLDSDLVGIPATLYTFGVAEVCRRADRAATDAMIVAPVAAAFAVREFPPNEVVMAPGHESGWSAATDLAQRVRAEVGVPVTTIGHSAAPPESTTP